MKTLAKKFKVENKGKFVYYNGAQGLEEGVINNQFADTYEEAVKLFAIKEGVSQEEIKNDCDNWYYIQPVNELDDNYLEKVLKEL